MRVDLIDVMGTDLTAVNAARVSFSKRKSVLDKSDEKLLRYLADNQHWSPFAHTCLQFHIKAPIFVARQLAKHQVGLVWNESSRRYVTDDPEVWSAGDDWREKADDVKQGSSDKTVSSDRIVEQVYSDACKHGLDTYAYLLSLGVCAEQARAVLPMSTYTEWYWTGSVYAFSRVCKQRLDPHTQKETRVIAQHIYTLCRKAFPLSWSALHASAT